jgi:hypothetical protein
MALGWWSLQVHSVLGLLVIQYGGVRYVVASVHQIVEVSDTFSLL